MPPSAVPPSSSSPNAVFDRRLHRKRRARAAPHFEAYSFLKSRAAEDLADRIASTTRPFERALDLGAHNGDMASRLAEDPTIGPRIDVVFQTDLADAYVKYGSLAAAADEEYLPFKDGAFDLVASALSLHWVNDLPGALIQIRRALRADGLFVGALFGGATLTELRQCLLEAEMEVRGGAAQRVSPFADAMDMAGLLQRAGFAMPVSDVDRLTVRYDTPFALLKDLRGMGETAAPATSDAPPLTRGVLMRAAALYQERFADPDGRIRATFEIISIAGWAPAPGQPKPKRPGSAQVRLADALGVEETLAGEKTAPRRPRGG